jgi:aminopeptidase N
VTIGDPGPDALFDFSVYARGAMTLQQLRVTVGDEDFFKILRRWASSQAGGNVTTDEFIALAERISHQQLDDLFQTWLFTPAKPDAPATATARAAVGSTEIGGAPAGASTLKELLVGQR